MGSKSTNIFFKEAPDSTLAVINKRYEDRGKIRLVGVPTPLSGQHGQIKIRKADNKELLLSTNLDDRDYFVRKFRVKSQPTWQGISFDENHMIGNESSLYPPGFTEQYGRSAAEALATRDFSGLSRRVHTWPSITKARFQINGEFGSLRKAEIQMTCGNIEQLNSLDAKLFYPLGLKVEARYGNFTQTPVNKSPWEEFVIYDWSWRYIDPKLIEITFKMVGASNLATAVDTANSVAGFWTDHKFVYDWKYFNEERSVQSLIDAMDYDLQEAIGVTADSDTSLVTGLAKLDAHRKAFTFPVAAGTGVKRFNLDSPLGKKYEDIIKPLNISHNCAGFAVTYRMDAVPGGEFDNTNELAGAMTGNDALEVYYSLGYVVHRLINYWLLELGANGDIADDIKKIKYSVRAFAKKRTYLTSVDPLNILITAPEPYNNQCTFGKYYVSNGEDGLKQPDSGNVIDGIFNAGRNTMPGFQPDGMTFRIYDVMLAKKTAVGTAQGKTHSVTSGGLSADELTAGNLATYSSIGGLGDHMLCENILISRNFLKSINPNQKAINRRFKGYQESDLANDDKIDVAEFLNAIFKKIKSATCDYIDLTLQAKSKAELFKNPTTEDHDQIWIVNRNRDISSDKISPCVFYTGKPKAGKHYLDGNVLKQNLQMKVPKDMAAEAFGRHAPGKTGGTNAKSITSKTKEPIRVLEHARNIEEARKKLFESSFSSAAVASARGAVMALYNAAQTISSKAVEESMPFPLSLDLHLQGVYGFSFGDYVGINFIPNSYKTFANNTGQSIAFTVLEVTHEFENDAKWVTHLKTIARLKGSADAIPTDEAVTKLVADQEFKEADQEYWSSEADKAAASKTQQAKHDFGLHGAGTGKA